MSRRSKTSISPAKVRTMLRAHLQEAARAIDGKDAPSDEDVHHGRKKIKRARASLRLLREAIGDDKYRRENVVLRDIARPLSLVRDAHVICETLEDLLKDEKVMRGADAAKLRRKLAGARESSRRALKAAERGKLVKELEGIQQRVARWKLPFDGTSLHQGIHRLYRKGRKSLELAQSEGTPEALHEARKQAKYLELAAEPLGTVSKTVMSDVLERAKEVEDELGVDRDLSLLKAKLKGLKRQIGGANKLVSQIEKQQRKRQAKALRMGKRLYAKKARKFMRRVAREVPTLRRAA